MFCLSSKKITYYIDEINNISEVIKHKFGGFVFLFLLEGFFFEPMFLEADDQDEQICLGP